MLNPSECGTMLSLSDVRIKQIFKDLVPEKEIYRTKEIDGKIKLTPPQVKKILNHRKHFYNSRVVTIGNEKGGVGKSLITINVAIRRANQGAKVLLIDLDPEGCATNFLLTPEEVQKDHATMLEVFTKNMTFKEAIIPSKYEFLDIVPCRGKARRVDNFVQNQNLATLIQEKIKGLKEIYDLILFEVPPTFSNIIASAYITSDTVVIPTFPDSWSLESVMLTIEDIEESCRKWQLKTPEIKVILNKYRADRVASRDAWDTMTKEFGSHLLPFHIKESADLQNSINNGKAIFESKNPTKVIRESFDLLAQFICPLLNEKMDLIQ